MDELVQSFTPTQRHTKKARLRKQKAQVVLNSKVPFTACYLVLFFVCRHSFPPSTGWIDNSCAHFFVHFSGWKQETFRQTSIAAPICPCSTTERKERAYWNCNAPSTRYYLHLVILTNNCVCDKPRVATSQPAPLQGHSKRACSLEQLCTCVA